MTLDNRPKRLYRQNHERWISRNRRAEEHCAMLSAPRPIAAVPIALALLLASVQFAHAEIFPWVLPPGQSTIQVRDPSQLARVPIPDIPPPATVFQPERELPDRYLSLDEAIRIALANSEVVRVLAGITAVSSGRTVYDPAIFNNRVDEQMSRFDPTLAINQAWNRREAPGFAFDPNLNQWRLVGSRRDDYLFDMGLSRTTFAGGTARIGVLANPLRDRPGFRQTPSALDLSYTQPLLRGGGWAANRVPIVLARIDAERSYFQLKDSVQELVLGVIEGYWSLVAARTDVWARQRQVEQAQFAFDRAQAALEVRIADASAAAQARVSLLNFRSTLVAAENAVLDREAALRNVLGLPPMDGQRIVPVSPPTTVHRDFEWPELLELAEQRRPDVIELKLILEADQQMLLLARNEAYPQLDAVGRYRWNGLEGTMPDGTHLRSLPGEFTDWTLGVNFSVPLGLRRGRAALRSQELIVARDRANLQQGLHAAAHQLALTLRSLERSWAQYDLARQTRDAARLNLNLQIENYLAGRVQFINVLLAINDWGNAIGSEAQFLSAYNAELANLDRQTGTILELHGVYFYEERFCSLGPLGELSRGREFPAALHPGDNRPRYPADQRPAEEAFDLQNPVERLDRHRPAPEQVPLPRKVTPVPH
jgi:outer membrane protein TolC